MKFDKVTPEHIRQYRSDILKSSSASTFDRKVFSLKKFFEWAVKEGYIDENPVEVFLKEEADAVETKVAKIERQKKVYAPSYGSLQSRIIAKLAGKPKLQKAVYSLFYTRPKWYQTYHSLPIASYFNYAILVILMSGLGFGIYTQFFKTTSTPLAYPTSLTRAGRYLSFQGRLTNILGNPITSATNVDFKLYNASASGTLLWDSGVCSITPDTDGIFSTLLGSSCGTEIAASVFSENAGVWLGVTVGADIEASPRVQIATVAYALNSETLQGYPASAAATINTVPVVNNSGQIVLAVSSPKIQSTSGNFAVEGQALTFDTQSGSGGSINIAPDGTGSANFTFSGSTPGNGKGMLYATDANLNSKALIYGSVTNDSSGYNLLELASGSTPRTKFAVDSAGNATLSGTINGLTLSGGTISTGVWNGSIIGTQYGGTGANNSSAAQYSIPYYSATGILGGVLSPGSSGYVLSTNSTGGAPTWISASSVGTNYWQLNSGALSPANISNSLNLGATATTSATVHLAGTSGENSFINTGNVGIGTTSPTHKLDIVTGNAIGLGFKYSTTFGLSSIQNQFSSSTDTGNYMQLRVNTAAGSDTPTLTLFGNGGTSVGSYSTSIAPTNGMIIPGNVGIGTTSPGQLLDVAGNIRSSGQLISTIATGTSPIVVSSTTLVSNLNADLLDGYQYNALPYVNNTTNSTLTRSGSGPYTLGINLSNANTWTGSQTFSRAYQNADGIPSNNLGNPSITEMALFDEEFNNKTAYYNINNLKFYTYDGSTWTEYTSFSDSDKRKFLGGDSNSGIVIPNGSQGFRIELTNNGSYVWLNALYMYWSSNSHSSQVQIWERNSITQTWSQVTSSTNTVSSWPGHLYLPFPTISFSNSTASSSYNDAIRIEFTPTWSTGSYSTQNISLYKMQIWGGYPAGKRNIFATDEYQNVTFPANLTAADLIISSASGTLNFSSGTGVKTITTTGGSDLALMPSGKVGIGTTSPQSKLHVVSDYGGMFSESTDTNRSNRMIIGADANGGFLKTDFNASGTLDMRFLQYSTEVMRLHSGNVGIGTTTPTAKLDVNGNVNITGYATASASLAVGNTNALAGVGNINASGRITGTSIYQGANQVCDTSGNCSSIGNYWQLNSGALSPANISNSLNLGATATTSATVHLAGTSGENSFINTGNVGIGTMAPAAKLTIGDSSSTSDPTYKGLIQLYGYTADGNTNTGLEFKSSSYQNGFGWRMTTPDNGTTLPLVFQSRTNSPSWTDRLTINSSNGYVGIATSSATAALDIYGQDKRVQLTNPGSTQYSGVGIKFIESNIADTANIFDIHTEKLSAGAGVGTANLFFRKRDAGYTNWLDFMAFEYDTNNVVFYKNVSGTTAGNVILQAGNLGVGTSSPTAKLDVAGNASTSGVLTFRGTTDPKINILNGENFGILTSPGGDAGLTEKLTVLSNGNVGIGTTSPGSALDVNGNIKLSSANPFIYFNDANNWIQLSGTNLITKANGSMYFRDGSNTDRYAMTTTYSFLYGPGSAGGVYINNVGNVGIGTTSPIAKLDVNGNLNEFGSATISASYAAGIPLTVKGAASQTANLQEWQNSSGTVLARVNSSGYLGIGADPGTNSLYVSRTLSDVSASSYNSQIYTIVNNGASTAPYNFRSMYMNTVVSSSSTGDITGSIYGFDSTVGLGKNSGTSSQVIAGKYSIANNGTGTITDQTGLLSSLSNTSTGSIGSQKGLNISLTNTGGGTITNAYGIYINNVASATNNYAIYTNAGDVRFGDDVSITGYATASGSLALGNTTAAAGPGNLNMTGVLTVGGAINGLNISSGTITNATWNGNLITSQYGGTGANNSAAAQYAVPYYSATGVLGGAVAPSTAGYVLSTNSTGSAPTWIPMSATGTNYWKLGAGTVSPFSDTLDVLFGNSATTSAKFAFTGVLTGIPTASISGSVANVATYLTGNGVLSTTNLANLTLGSSTTGNVIINSKGSTALTASGTTLTAGGIVYFANGTTYYVDASGNVNMNAGTFAGTFTANGNTQIGDATSDAFTVYPNTWNLTNSQPNIDLKGATVNALSFETSLMSFDTSNSRVGIGTTTPTSILDVAGAASVSGSLTFRAGAGSIQTTAMNPLTIGGATTGNITLNPSNAAAGGYVAPGTTNVTDLGTASLLWRNVYATKLYQGTSQVCDLSGNCTSATDYWSIANGAIYPKSTSVDLLLGGTATTSAKFAFINVLKNTPTASISGSTANVALFMDGNGNISTTNRANLTLGNSATYNTTGNILLNPNGTGYVGIGTATPQSTLQIGTGQLLLPDGYAGGPSLSFTNNTNMGFYRKQNNVMAAVANGQEALMFSGDTGIGTMTIGNVVPVNEKLLITGAGTMDYMRVGSGSSDEIGNVFIIQRSGNVGIGTIAPQQTLDVNGYIRGQRFVDASGDNYYIDPAAATVSATLAGDASMSGSLVFNAASINTIDILNGARLDFQTSVGGDAGLAAKMTLLNNGYLGIGTITPTALLDIAGDASTSGSLVFKGTSPSTIDILNGNRLDFQTSTSGDAGLAAKMTLLNNGYLGIGTITPTALLDIAGDASSSGSLVFRGTSPTTIDILNGSRLAFNTSVGGDVGLTERMTILNNGYVGIGSTAPTNRLVINDDLGAAVLPDATVSLGNATGNSVYQLGQGANDKGFMKWVYNAVAASAYLNIGTGANAQDIVLTGGNVGIGTTDPQQALDVNGYIRGQRFVDTSSGTYYIDPAAATVSAFLAGNIVNSGAFSITTNGSNGSITLDAGSGNVVIGDGSTSKLDAGTIDPPYTINGSKYATYVSSMTGVKEETTGTAMTSEFIPGQGYRTSLDFANAADGSDLWIFSNVTRLSQNANKLVVLLSPAANTKAWYSMDASGKLYIYTSQPTTVSYRLTAPRFDAERWLNTRDNGVAGFTIDNTNTWPALSEVSDLGQVDFNNYNLVASSDGTQKYNVVNSVTGQLVQDVTELSQAIIGNIKAGVVVTKDLATNTFEAFQGSVDNMLVKSGLVAGRIQTKLISPLADSTDITVQIGSEATPSGKFAIENSSGDTVASIDNIGNATFSGTLFADKINSKSLDDIQNMLTQVKADQDLLAQASTWNINSTNSASLTQIATADLYVTNQAAVNSLSVTNSLTLGTDMVFGSSIDGQGTAINSLDTLTSPLKIQSLAMAPVEIMAGLIKIDTKGNVQIAGDLAVAGNIDSAGLTLKDNPNMATPSANLLTLQNSDGSTVSTVDASGSATFNTIMTQGLTIAGATANATASAVVNGVITTNATAGSAIIPAGTSEITIKNDKVTDYTLVYVTPTSSTNNYVLYVKSKGAGQFVVGFTNPIDTDVNFNWWIVKVSQ